MLNNSTCGRRQFLGQIATLGVSAYSSFSTAGIGNPIHDKVTNGPADQGQLVELRQRASVFGNADEFQHFRAQLLACSLNPWLRSCQYSNHPDQFVALAEMKRVSGEMKIATLLDYSEYSDAEEMDTEGGLTFLEWLPIFQPSTRDDFLMALPLYRWHQRTGQLVPSKMATSDPWLDAQLRNTRGILLWSQQWKELIRIIGGTNMVHATYLYSGYLHNRADAFNFLRQTRYFVTGQTLLQIIEDRSVGGLHLGNPDYLLGDWLHQYYRSQG